ncbi:MAG: hypothetical protein A2908_01475 [Candidatus Staskawiczbacteria bacterium RIFCSPLOWO2_01_FULL_38_12b]|uniref:ComEC/Rec2-related protein domain-containing protein n=1 Tax=Candidatus Staskawiczbacteria bacterium RIFCSPLOWO2_01_FULL_38_12b TaxID=1802214 RepID=A0A1G2ICU3_9BACT|nr:MAG: hypothetical protein A2908_01475 [Candidatus Staskawiczbacteria bacterium RIFCSPLOWO2_01_FULL_38_12b]
MTPSKTFFYFCISFVIGIALASIIKIPQIFIWGVFVFGMCIIFVSLFLEHTLNSKALEFRVCSILGFCVLVLVLGIMRFQISEFAMLHDTLRKLNDAPEKVILIGQIIAEPDIRATTQKLQVKIKDTQSVVLVTSGFYGDYRYLDTIQITGKLKTPSVINEFNYKHYLAKDGIYSVMDYPKIEIISQKHDYNIFSYTYEKVLFIKTKLTDSINFNFSPPQSFILQGMVFGNDKAMPKELKNKFTVTGLSHVTAVSGTNIIILINMVMIFLLALGLWRGQAFYVAVIFIWVYIILIGFPASGVRAAMMGSVGILAQKLGRQNTSSRMLVVTATLMLLQNPLLLAYDIGFQLSFLASLGIIYIKPFIDTMIMFLSFAKKQVENPSISLKARTEKNPLQRVVAFFLDIISITLSAQIVTLPIIVYNFGVISLIAPITNVLALPVVQALTVMGFLTSIAGAFSNILGFIFSLPCYFLLLYFLKVLDIFSKPWAVKTIANVSWIWLVAYYVILAGIVWYFNKHKKLNF